MVKRAENNVNDLTRQVSGKVRVVHEAVAGKLDTLQPDWNVDVIEPEETHQPCQETCSALI